MKITLLHLYPEAMSLYGEYANLTLLSRYLTWRGAEVEVRAVGCDDTPDFAGADLIYMGAGTERTQKAALSWLFPCKEALKKAVDGGAMVFFTGNAMELLGESVTDQKGTRFECLGFGSFTTVETDKRVPHDIIAQTPLFSQPVVGFMNKCSYTAGVTSPLFDRLTLGEGNEGMGGGEGYVSGNLFATHLTGPVLVKNPAFTRLMVARIFAHNGWLLPDSLPALPYEQEAYQMTLRELSARTGG